MASIKTNQYILYPSDNPQWVIIESNDGLKVDTEVRLFGFRHRCKPSYINRNGFRIPCSYLCCYAGCYVSAQEIRNVEKILPDILKDLQDDSQRVIEQYNNQIYDPSDRIIEDDLYKIRCAPTEWYYEESPQLSKMSADEIEQIMEKEFKFPPKNHCLFLMKNGFCALHKYFLEIGEIWYHKENKFNICTTFPLDIRVQDHTIGFMENFEEFFFEKVACVSYDEELKKALNMPYIIYSMKEIIIDRFGETWWKALNQVAKDWRANKIKILSLYDKSFQLDLGNEEIGKKD